MPSWSSATWRRWIPPSCWKSRALRLAWPDIMRLFPPKFASTSSESPYQSLNCCVPITWLREAALMARTIEVVNAQLRLPLTM